MPAIILLIVFIGLAGGIQFDGNQPDSTDGFSVSAEYTNPDTFTGYIPGGVVSDIGNGNVNPNSFNLNLNNTQETGLETTDVELLVKSANNIDFRRATLRGEIALPDNSRVGPLFFAYSDSQSRLIANTQPDDSYQDLKENTDIAVSFITQTVSRSASYQRTISNLLDDERYYYRFCAEGVAGSLMCSTVTTFETVEDTNRNTAYRAPSVSTQRAENIEASTATLTGSYNINSAENAVAFFVYGESQTLIASIPSDYDEYSDVREAGDNLQKVRIRADATGSDRPERTIEDLERETTYYHRLCVSYDDDTATEIRCGGVLNFTTDDRDRDRPVIRTASVLVGGTSAAFTATIDMEDYRDGHAFLVYGTNESSIEQVPSRNRFTSVTQNGDQIQRVSIDVDFDGRDTVTQNVTDLLPAAAYYYRFCVEYEAENDFGNETQFLSCSDTETFSTN